ncbi:glycine betaine ABC transporter substrate-binding protein [Paenibacillus sp. GCM10023252]|uniref:glycine betaine ABC transporter substrate-binding protein n=1 Tax=Paenibacillus sp. GCM10023252 TaxID=3252649 RepID=UPI0036092D3E
MNLWEVLVNRQDDIIRATMEHIQISFISLLIAIVISIPLGLALTRLPRLAGPIIGITSLFQTIPSLALLGFMIPLLGIGMLPAIIALTVYALLPILRNTYTGIMNVEQPIKEAGVGMGMTSMQVMVKVELPLALSVIMAGIRTATVMLIGVATLASLVGAGGLGDLIFRGISTVNTELILAGTIPAALLAIVFDFLLGRMEGAVTPKGLKGRGKKKSRLMRVTSIVLASGLLLLVVVGIAMSSIGGGEERIVIGGKNFTEQDILVEMTAALIEEKTDMEVQRKPFLGGSQVTHNALVSGDIDMYVEYTGTGWTSVLQQKPLGGEPELTYDKVQAAYEKEFQVKWLKPLGFNNTFALAMRKEKAKELGVKTLSDLAGKSSSLVLGASHEFLERPDGYVGLEQVYGMKFKDTKGLDVGLIYGALRDAKTDVSDAATTDGRIAAFNLQVMEDDQHFFPPYYAAPIVRMDTLEAHPELEEVLNLLAGKLSDEAMAKLNSEVDLGGKEAREVAVAWLKANGLVK